MSDDNRWVEVIIHRFIAFGTKFFYTVYTGSLFTRSDAFQPFYGFLQTLQSLFGSLQGFVAEVHRAAIVCLKDEETDGHRTICLCQQLVWAFKELAQVNKVAITLAHLLSIDGNHVIVHPVVNHIVSLRSHTLCNFTFVVWENQVHASTVNVEMFTQVFLAHSSAFAVPSGETVAPWAGPAHDMFRLSCFPQSEVGRIMLFALSVQFAGGVQHIVQVTSR